METYFSIQGFEPRSPTFDRYPKPLDDIENLEEPRGIEPRSTGWKPVDLTDSRWLHKTLVEYLGIEPSVPEAGDLQSPESPLILLLHTNIVTLSRYAVNRPRMDAPVEESV